MPLLSSKVLYSAESSLFLQLPLTISVLFLSSFCWLSFDEIARAKIELKNKLPCGRHFITTTEKIKATLQTPFFVTTYRKSNIQHSVISISISILSNLQRAEQEGMCIVHEQKVVATRRAHVLRRLHTSLQQSSSRRKYNALARLLWQQRGATWQSAIMHSDKQQQHSSRRLRESELIKLRNRSS